MQLNGGSKRARTSSQSISFRPPPRAPFDDYGNAKRQKLLSTVPLQSFYLLTPHFVVQVEREPFIHSSAEKRIARSLPSSCLARVVLPEPGKPHTIINLGPVPHSSIMASLT